MRKELNYPKLSCHRQYLTEQVFFLLNMYILDLQWRRSAATRCMESRLLQGMKKIRNGVNGVKAVWAGHQC